MDRYVPITLLAIFLMITFFPCQVLAASITETKAAIGEGCTASGDNSTAMGEETTASEWASTAMGYNSTASGMVSTAMGYRSTASGDRSTAMGEETTASGLVSTAMGYNSTASGMVSTAMGGRSIAGGDYSWVGGRYMQLTNAADNTFVWGYSESAQPISTSNAFLIFPAGQTGKVGIGTSSPNELLEIAGDGRAFFGDGGGSSRKGLLIDGIQGSTGARLEAYDYSSNTGLDLVINTTGGGNVGIGTTSPSYKLHVNGTAAGTSWTNLSSREYKENICKVDVTALPMMLAKLMNMDITTYNYKKEYGGEGDTKLGFIAEDLPEEVLSKNGKGVDLYELLTLTIGAMKAQNKEIEVQKLENRTLKAKVSELFKRIDALEK